MTTFVIVAKVCKQFGLIGQTEHPSGSEQLDTLIVFLKDFIDKVTFDLKEVSRQQQKLYLPWDSKIQPIKRLLNFEST